MRTVFFLLFCVILVQIRAQQEILSLSAFQPCIIVDDRVGQPGYNSNITNIDCGPAGPNQNPVTVLNLLFSPNVGSEVNFTFNLSIVAGSTTTLQNTTSKDPNLCQVGNNNLELCTLTTPALIQIKSTRLAYKYALSLNTQNIVPFCYAGTSLFELFGHTEQNCLPFHINPVCTVNQENPPALDCTTTEADACIPIQLAKDTNFILTKNKINSMAGSALTDQFKLSSFQRVQEPFFPGAINCGNEFFLFNTVWNGRPNTDPSVPTTQYNWDWVFQRQGNLYNLFDPNTQSSIYDSFTQVPPTSSTYCRLYQNPTEPDLYYDNPNLDIRIPVVYPQPSIFGFTPSPVYRNLVTDPINGDPDLIVAPVGFTTFNYITGSISYGCAGYDCNANQDERKIVTANLDNTHAEYANSVHSIVGLGPYCAVYDITAIPEIFAQITIEVIINPNTPQQAIETIVIDNLNPSSSQRSDPSGFVFGKIEAIFAANKVLGPSIQGEIVVCGQDYEQFVNGASGQDQSNTFPNMQCLVPGVVCDGNQNVDTTQSTSFSEATNPWETIIAQSQAQPGFEKRTQFYPHPYDYMIPDPITNQKEAGFTFLPNDHGQTFWYFVDQDTFYNQFGKNCNEIGMSIGTNSAQQNSNLWCNIDPHECLPGLGRNANGGYKNAVPCIVSEYMNIASGLYDGTNFPFPYGTAGLSAADAAKYAFNSETFINWTRGNVSNFVPSNPFVSAFSNQQLYDPTNPQFWLGKERGNGGAFLYYSPTFVDNNVTQSLTSIGINLVLDVAGNFVSYNVAVAQGQIDLTQTHCNLTQGSIGTAAVAVINPSNPALATSTTYVLTLNCDTINNGAILPVSPPSIEFTLAPGQETVATFSVGTPNNPITSNNVGCVATLSYSEVIATSDQKVINCGYQLADLPPQFNFSGPTPPNPPPPGTFQFNCSGFCDLACRVNAGKVYQDGCFWIIVIFAGILPAILALAAIGQAIYLRTKFVALRTQTKGSTDRFVEQELSKEKS